MMNITNYNELFALFDNIISLTSDEDLFLCQNSTSGFNFVIESYFRSTSVYSDTRELRSSLISYSGLLASFSMHVSSLISCHDKKKAHRYQLSFEKSFPFILSYLQKPYNYFVYNIYPNEDKVFISRDLFVDDVNIVISYHHKVFIVHKYEEYDEDTPFITLLSPCIMFKNESFSLEFIED